MLFNSTHFIVFLACVVVAYHHMSLQQRRYLLLIASYTFYWVWSVPFSLLLVASTVTDYAAARVIDASTSQARRRMALLFSIVTNLGLLGIFKYADFFSDTTNSILGTDLLPQLNWVLPLGISFYTFQTMSYTIDVYRGVLPARRSLIDVALYVSFFPQLVAGPIVRADVLMPQLCQQHTVDWVAIRRGLGLIMWGLAKKVYVADSMAHIVNEVYGSPATYSGGALLMATYAFAIQIYCDFSGYTDIAIGAALLLGIRLPKNFDAPYLSCSIREFWRRWHISLSTWLRDYLYIPLGGSRKGVSRTYISLMVTMLLGGLWHGAGWHWVVWGGLQGAMMSIERALGISERPPQQMFVRVLRWFIVLHLVCLSWVFFRASDVTEALYILRRIATMATGDTIALVPAIVLLGLIAAELLGVRQKFLAMLQSRPTVTRWLAYAAVLILVLTYARASNPEFIYFQF